MAIMFKGELWLELVYAILCWDFFNNFDIIIKIMGLMIHHRGSVKDHSEATLT